MAVTTTKTNKPINPRGNDQSPKGYNRAALYSGKALDFDGVNDDIQISSFSTTGSTRSLSYYFKSSVSDNERVLSIRSGSNFFNSTILNGKINTFDGVNGINTNKTFNDNKWHHVVITHNGNNNAAIYVDGVSQELDASTFSVHDITNQTLYICSESGTAQFYTGGLSNVRLFDVALTAAQVSDLYNNPEKIVPTGVEDTALKLWLPMMEGAGTTAYDGSGNGNHGTISGATYVHGVGAPVAQSAVMDWNKGQNLLKYSEELDRGSYWSTTAAIVTSNDTTAPDGQETADLLKETTTSAPHYINIGVITAASTTYVQSVWVKKKDDGIYAGIRTNGVGGDSYIIFDFDTATIVAAGSDIISNGVEAYSNGWYRIYMTYTLQPTGAIYSVTNSSSSVIPSYTGTGKGYYIWGAQLEASDSLTAYIPNHTETPITSPVLLPQGLASGRDITGVNLFENVRKQGALNLDGNSWAEVHDNASIDLTTSATLECWYKWGTQLNAGLVGRWDYPNNQRSLVLLHGTLDNARLLFSFDGTNASALEGTSTPAEGTWVHIVGTYDGTTFKLYVNATQEATASSTGVLYNSPDPLEIGRHGYGAIGELNGSIAQPRIYNRALTAEEVQRNYDAGKNIYTNS